MFSLSFTSTGNIVLAKLLAHTRARLKKNRILKVRNQSKLMKEKVIGARKVEKVRLNMLLTSNTTNTVLA